jgi:hypothetical protein
MARSFVVIIVPRSRALLSFAIVLRRGALIMCHGYAMKWWKSETTTTKKLNEPIQQDKKAKAVSEEKIEEKELIPAE